ncbi:hypothetical protein FOPG_19311 [Fusarium oxysporum f. sp. conglutinans race 2 54008]|uniref:Uncharacterized protein n=1 Tax=Fusarium oxysporum f. sp. conglutinans race 2 54008 TaxID=1089457 RepID=X0HTD1_FUSOX|nr:hypothetical protein FOPG_19311 [Fusarium oxysporum f. sp. conglutinans race 2 54008]
MRQVACNHLRRTFKLHILLTYRLVGYSPVPRVKLSRHGQKHYKGLLCGDPFSVFRNSKPSWRFREARHPSPSIWTFPRRPRRQTRRDREMQRHRPDIEGRRRSCRKRTQNNYKSSGMKGASWK